MRLKSAALFAVGVLFVSFWLHGGARCQSSLAPPLSLAPPPSVTNKDSPPAATSNPSPAWPILGKMSDATGRQPKVRRLRRQWRRKSRCLRRPTTFHREQRPPNLRHDRQPPRTRHRL